MIDDVKRKLLITALHENYGILTPSLDAAKISNEEFEELIKSDTSLAKEIADSERIKTDLAEMRLMQLVNSGDLDAIKFVLTLNGTPKGYSSKPSESDHNAVKIEKL